MTDDSTISGVSRRAAIRATIDDIAANIAVTLALEHGIDLPPAAIDAVAADLQPLIGMLEKADAAVDQITQERDEARANNARSICVFCGAMTPFQPDASQEDRVLAMWTHAEGCTERPEKRLAAEIERLDELWSATTVRAMEAEAALAVLTQRHQPIVTKLRAASGQLRHAYWLLQNTPIESQHTFAERLISPQIRRVEECADELEQALGLLGSTAPEDATR